MRMKKEDAFSLAFVILFFGLAVLAIIVLCNKFHTLDDVAVKYETETYIVKEGDTLWEIAEEYKPEGYEIRKYVEKVRELNDITPDIYPGQQIKIYIAKEVLINEKKLLDYTDRH